MAAPSRATAAWSSIGSTYLSTLCRAGSGSRPPSAVGVEHDGSCRRLPRPSSVVTNRNIFFSFIVSLPGLDCDWRGRGGHPGTAVVPPPQAEPGPGDPVDLFFPFSHQDRRALTTCSSRTSAALRTRHPAPSVHVTTTRSTNHCSQLTHVCPQLGLYGPAGVTSSSPSLLVLRSLLCSALHCLDAPSGVITTHGRNQELPFNLACR